jgi:hypothetical protein
MIPSVTCGLHVVGRSPAAASRRREATPEHIQPQKLVEIKAKPLMIVVYTLITLTKEEKKFRD